MIDVEVKQIEHRPYMHSLVPAVQHLTFGLPAGTEHSSKAQRLLCQVARPWPALLLGDSAEQLCTGCQHRGRLAASCQVCSDGALLCSPPPARMGWQGLLKQGQPFYRKVRGVVCPLWRVVGESGKGSEVPGCSLHFLLPPPLPQARPPYRHRRAIVRSRLDISGLP